MSLRLLYSSKFVILLVNYWYIIIINMQVCYGNDVVNVLYGNVNFIVCVMYHCIAVVDVNVTEFIRSLKSH